MPRPPAQPPPIAVILAAGEGTRMRSRRPKVLHRAAGRPLLEWVLAAARGAGLERILVVVGHGAEELRAAVADGSLEWVVQERRGGTGHALAQVEAHLEGRPATLIVLSGDVPLVSASTIHRLLDAAGGAWGALAVAELAQPGSLGRAVGADGRLQRIVEAADATPEELAIRRVNAGIYALPAPQIFDYLRRIDTANAQGELYLTDALSVAAEDGETVALVELPDASEAVGVNDRRDLAGVHATLLRRRLEAAMDSGVTVLDPSRTVIEPGVLVGEDTVIHPDVTLLGSTQVGAGCELLQGAWLRDSVLEAEVSVQPYCVLDGARVETGCRIGPFARLRPGARLRRGARVGNFVEIKQAELGEGAKAGHLAYLGDATIGPDVNIGAGVITCNYDGVAKHRTEIAEGAFIGSDTMLVAPVRIGAGATTGAGSVINQDVPDAGLGIARARQRNIPEWDRRKRQGPKR